MSKKSIVSREDFSDRPPPTGCTCGHIACVCNIKARHKPDCKFLIAATGPIGIECEHGSDVCPICDPCECGTQK